MIKSNFLIKNYLEYCESQKRLDPKTIKSYKIDLKQFSEFFSDTNIIELSTNMIESYIANLHRKYQPKTVKRKIASLKALFHYLEYKEFIEYNPFHKLHIQFREPLILPKIIPLNVVELFMKEIYHQRCVAKTDYQRKNALRDAAVIELLFATGIRISELCNLKENSIDLTDGTILIRGKGNKERRIQICNEKVISVLLEYRNSYHTPTCDSYNFFINQNGTPLSDQSVRRMIKKYSKLSNIELQITPHMFRHTFATSLLENDVDIRYIQEMLGHSSINITEIYTHVSTSKQRSILSTKHPRNNFTF